MNELGCTLIPQPILHLIFGKRWQLGRVHDCCPTTLSPFARDSDLQRRGNFRIYENVSLVTDVKVIFPANVKRTYSALYDAQHLRDIAVVDCLGQNYFVF